MATETSTATAYSKSTGKKTEHTMKVDLGTKVEKSEGKKAIKTSVKHPKGSPILLNEAEAKRFKNLNYI